MQLTVAMDEAEQELLLFLIFCERLVVLLNESSATFSVVIDNLHSLDNLSQLLER